MKNNISCYYLKAIYSSFLILFFSLLWSPNAYSASRVDLKLEEDISGIVPSTAPRENLKPNFLEIVDEPIFSKIYKHIPFIKEPEWNFLSAFCSHYSPSFQEPISSEKAKDYLDNLYKSFSMYAKVPNSSKLNFTKTTECFHLLSDFINGGFMVHEALRKAWDNLSFFQTIEIEIEKDLKTDIPFNPYSLSQRLAHLKNAAALDRRLNEFIMSAESLIFQEQYNNLIKSLENKPKEESLSEKYKNLSPLINLAIDKNRQDINKIISIIGVFTRKLFSYLNHDTNESGNLGILHLEASKFNPSLSFGYLKNKNGYFYLPLPLDYLTKTIFWSNPYIEDGHRTMISVEKGKVITSPGLFLLNFQNFPFGDMGLKIPSIRVHFCTGANDNPSYFKSEPESIYTDSTDFLSNLNNIKSWAKETSKGKETLFGNFHIDEQMKNFYTSEQKKIARENPAFAQPLNKSLLSNEGMLKYIKEMVKIDNNDDPSFFMKSIISYIKTHNKENNPNYQEFIVLPSDNLEEKLLLLNFYQDLLIDLKEQLEVKKRNSDNGEEEAKFQEKQEINVRNDEDSLFLLENNKEKSIEENTLTSLVHTLSDNITKLEEEILQSDEFEDKYEELIRKEQEEISAQVTKDSLKELEKEHKKKNHKKNAKFKKEKANPTEKKKDDKKASTSSFITEKRKHLGEMSARTRLKFTQVRKLFNLAQKEAFTSEGFIKTSIKVDGSHVVMHIEGETPSTFVKKHGGKDLSYNSKDVVTFVNSYLSRIKQLSKKKFEQ